MKDFRELDVWERAYMLNVSVYDLTLQCSGLVRYGLASQMRHASTALAAGIAEGCGSSGNNGGHWHFNAALGSAASLEYLFLLGFELSLISDDDYAWFHQMAVDIQGMLRSMLSERTMGGRSPASLTLVN